MPSTARHTLMSGAEKVMTMLDVDAVDLDELAMALEDHSWESSWYRPGDRSSGVLVA